MKSPSVPFYCLVTGFPGYRVGTDGTVWGRLAHGASKTIYRRWRKLKANQERGANAVLLRTGKDKPRYKSHLVYRLVAEEFLGAPPKTRIVHLNGDIEDDTVENLKWIEIGYSFCINCKKEKSLKYFTRRATVCKECESEVWKKAKLLQLGSLGEYRKYIRGQNLKRKYGISSEKFEEILEEQGKKCKICGCQESGLRRFHVDHCHETGLIRGILCHGCNTGLGAFKEDPSRLRKAFEYLKFSCDN
jgi:hypothetical protein